MKINPIKSQGNTLQQQNVIAKRNPVQGMKGQMTHASVKTLTKVACIGAVFAITATAVIAANKFHNPPPEGLKTICMIKGPKETIAANTAEECSLAEESIKNGASFEGIETIRRSAATSLACNQVYESQGFYTLPLASQPEFQAQSQEARFTPSPSVKNKNINSCVNELEMIIIPSCKEYERRQKYQNFLTKGFYNLFESCESINFKDKDRNAFTFTKRLI